MTGNLYIDEHSGDRAWENRKQWSGPIFLLEGHMSGWEGSSLDIFSCVKSKQTNPSELRAVPPS